MDNKWAKNLQSFFIESWVRRSRSAPIPFLFSLNKLL